MSQGKRIAILIEQGFDDAEFIELLKIATDVGLTWTVGNSYSQSYRGRQGSLTITAAMSAEKTRADDFDVIVVPGGYAPDEMRLRQSMIDMVKRADDLGKVIVAVSHGPQLLISADILKGRRVTSWPSIAVDVENAGGLWTDEPVVQDGNLISVGKPCDLVLLGALLKQTLDRDTTRAALEGAQAGR